MCAEIFRTGEPYQLLGNRMCFTSWYFIRPCSFGWYDDNGRNVSVHGNQDPLEAHIRRQNQPIGVRIVAKPAVRSARLLQPERPWEDGNECLTTVIQEGGVYRAWGNVGGWGDLRGRGETFFCYFESDDGYNWKRPNCGVLNHGQITKTNLLAEKGGTVFVDPVSPAPERYKWIADHSFTPEEYEIYKKQRPGEIDPRCERHDAKLLMGAQGAVSSDGLHWQVIPHPLVMTHTDTQVVAYYDTVLQKYVGYFRDWMVGPQGATNEDPKGLRWLHVGRRSIGRSETSDFRRFPLPQRILEPGPAMDPNHVFYTNCKTTIPGAPDQHLMFPAIWDTVTDTTVIGLYSSCDGRIWNEVPGSPIFATAPFGEWDGGCVFASPNLIELPDGTFALPYTGYNVPHKYPRVKATRSTGYALWPRGRIVGLEAADRGEFTTTAVIPPGNKLLINAETKRAGHILIEALDLHLRPISGRTFADAVPIIGDQCKAPVKWKGHEDLGIAPGEPVILRFRLDRATIYALEFS